MRNLFQTATHIAVFAQIRKIQNNTQDNGGDRNTRYLLFRSSLGKMDNFIATARLTADESRLKGLFVRAAAAEIIIRLFGVLIDIQTMPKEEIEKFLDTLAEEIFPYEPHPDQLPLNIDDALSNYVLKTSQLSSLSQLCNEGSPFNSELQREVSLFLIGLLTLVQAFHPGLTPDDIRGVLSPVSKHLDS